MKNKSLLLLAIGSLALSFVACEEEEEPTPVRPGAECTMPKCEGQSVWLCENGKFKFSENCDPSQNMTCELGKCVSTETPTPTLTTCVNGQKRCGVNNIPQTCNGSSWVSGNACAAGQTCVNGECTGTPTQEPDPTKCTAPKCEGNKSYVCMNGVYVFSEECQTACENGECVEEETLCTGQFDGCYCTGDGSKSFCCKDGEVTGELACGGDTAICVPDGDAPKCVGCRTETDCPTDKPVCSGNVCEEKNAEWCKNKEDGDYCRTENGVDTGFSCENGKVAEGGFFGGPVVCDQGNAVICRVIPGGHGYECVECLQQSDCPSGMVCTSSNTCITPGKDDACAKNKSVVGEMCYTFVYQGYIVNCEYGTEKNRTECKHPQGTACLEDSGSVRCGCVHDSDCSGYKCQSGGTCSTSCESDKDCNNLGLYKYSCQNKKCVQGSANEGCTKDADCGDTSKYECKEKVCVEKSTGGCTKDSDCPSGHECKDKVCVEKAASGGKTYKETFADKDGEKGKALSYQTETFDSKVTGISWSVNDGSWGHVDKGKDYSIEDGGLIFRKAVGYIEGTMADGIASISVDVKSALTTADKRKAAIFIDDSSTACGTVEFDGDQGASLHVLKCDVNKSGSVKVKIANNSSKHIIIDNITWTNKK